MLLSFVGSLQSCVGIVFLIIHRGFHPGYHTVLLRLPFPPRRGGFLHEQRDHPDTNGCNGSVRREQSDEHDAVFVGEART